MPAGKIPTPSCVMMRRTMSLFPPFLHRLCVAALLLAVTFSSAHSQAAGWRDLLSGTGKKAADTFGEWRDRMFSVIKDEDPLGDAGADLPIVPTLNVPERFAITPLSPKQAFPQGDSHYRMIELSREFAHVAVRLRVMAVPNRSGRGNSVMKPIIYVLDDAEQVRDEHAVDPLLLDMQPFKRTRLLACTSLENVRRFIVATPAKAVGTWYEMASRSAVKAPKTSYGFYYSTDSIKVKLPYAETGEFVIEVTEEASADAGCDGQNVAKKADDKTADPSKAKDKDSASNG